MTGMQTMIEKKEKCKHANCAGNHEKSKMRRDMRFTKSLQSQDLARRLNFQANKCLGP
jgi:hypothetical protein